MAQAAETLTFEQALERLEAAVRDLESTDTGLDQALARYEEGVQLLGTMVAYAGTFSLGKNVVVHHIDTSWNQAWTGTNQIRYFVLEGDTLTIGTDVFRTSHEWRKVIWRRTRRS